MFLVFGGERYYAAGGAFDLLGKFSDEGSAIAMAADIIGRTAITPAETESEWDAPHEFTIEWSHVLNVESGEIIARHGSACGAGRMSELACANKEESNMLINHSNKQHGAPRKSDSESGPNNGMPVGIMTDNGMIGRESNMVWDPKDQYASCPPCKCDEHGRYYVSAEPETEDWLGPCHLDRIMIDTRIPLEARKPMSLGEVPVLSYQEWLDSQGDG